MAPQSRHTPATPGELRQIVAEAADAGLSLEVCGGGSKRPMCMHPVRHASAQLDMSALTGITAYDPDELVLTALAGTPLAQIEAALEERQQMFAFDPFDHGPLFGEAAGRATLGGIIAANVSGSRRLSAGAARDHILGFTAVSGRGEAFKGGGAVVKNVTGFDLPKLMAGSFGTLAVLVSLTVRVLPRPRSEATVLLRGLSDEAANQAMTLAASSPAAVSSAAHRCTDGGLTAMRIEGFGPAVEARCRELRRSLQTCGTSEVIHAEQSAALWRGVRTLESLPTARHVLWRLSLPPARGWRVRHMLNSVDAGYLYDWAGGLVWVTLPEDAPDARDSRIRDIARALGGCAKLIKAPPALRAALVRPAGTVAAAAVDADHGLRRLHSRIKSAFDPKGVLNPGLDLADEL